MTHTAQTPSNEALRDELEHIFGHCSTSDGHECPYWDNDFNQDQALDTAVAMILGNFRSVWQIEAAIGEDQQPAQQSSGIERILQPDCNRIKWQNELRAQIRKALNLNKKEDV